MQALAATGDAPLPEPWSEGSIASSNGRYYSGGSRIYIAAREDGGQVSTGNRLDAMNASYYVEEHPETSIEDALTFVIKQRVALDGLKVVGNRVEIDASHAIDATLSP